MFMHVEGLPAFDLCLLEQHGTDGAMQMHLSFRLSRLPFPVSHSRGIQVHGDTARGGVPCGSRLPCSDGNALTVTEKRRTGGKRDGDRREEREKGCRGRAEERVWHTRSSPRNLSVS